jgi:hypothetical protein
VSSATAVTQNGRRRIKLAVAASDVKCCTFLIRRILQAAVSYVDSQDGNVLICSVNLG